MISTVYSLSALHKVVGDRWWVVYGNRGGTQEKEADGIEKYEDGKQQRTG